MNEREEMKNEENEREARINSVRSEMLRLIPAARTVFLTAVTPEGVMSTQCFFQGYADLRALQAEVPERLHDLVMGNRRSIPSQLA